MERILLRVGEAAEFYRSTYCQPRTLYPRSVKQRSIVWR